MAETLLNFNNKLSYNLSNISNRWKYLYQINQLQTNIKTNCYILYISFLQCTFELIDKTIQDLKLIDKNNCQLNDINFDLFDPQKWISPVYQQQNKYYDTNQSKKESVIKQQKIVLPCYKTAKDCITITKKKLLPNCLIYL